MRSPLLLDSCAAIWLAEDKLPTETVEILTRRYREGEPLFLSPITGWELGLLFSRGRYRASISPAEFLRRLFSLPGIKLAPMPADLLLQSSFLPGSPPPDPADRIMAATAREYGYTLLTRDARLLGYAQQGHLRALPC